MRWPAAVTAVAAVIVFVPPARGLWLRFFDSLRIAGPERASVNVPSFTGPGANRQRQNIVASMVADTASVTLGETGGTCRRRRCPPAPAAVPV